MTTRRKRVAEQQGLADVVFLGNPQANVTFRVLVLAKEAIAATVKR